MPSSKTHIVVRAADASRSAAFYEALLGSPPAQRREGPQVAPDRAGELLGRRCIRCGAVGTHYLTCPSLRLPPGYRLSAEHGPECLCGRPASS